MPGQHMQRMSQHQTEARHIDVKYAEVCRLGFLRRCPGGQHAMQATKSHAAPATHLQAEHAA